MSLSDKRSSRDHWMRAAAENAGVDSHSLILPPISDKTLTCSAMIAAFNPVCFARCHPRRATWRDSQADADTSVFFKFGLDVSAGLQWAYVIQ